MKIMLTLITLAVGAASLAACAEYPGPPPARVVVQERGVWVPGHYNGWRFVPGHWR